MDCLFNLQIPKSNEHVYIIRPKGKLYQFSYFNTNSGKTFITGVASSYSLKYNAKLLQEHISQDEFTTMIMVFNETLFNFWPCPLCYCTGYIFSICTCGKFSL